MYRPSPPPTGATVSANMHGRGRAMPFNICLLVRAGIMLLLAASLLTASDARAQVAPIERKIAGGELHTLRLRLDRGKFVRAVFDQRGIDIVLTLIGPGGERLLEVDSPSGAWGPEPLFFEVEREGFYVIEVRPRVDGAGPGRYEFRMEARRPLPSDQMKFPAERVFAEATRLLSDKRADSLRGGIAKYEEALALFRSINDWNGEVTTLLTLASVSYALGESQQALQYYAGALAILRSTSDSAAEARALSGMAFAYHSLGDDERALKHFRQALTLFRAAGDSRTAAYTLDNVGDLHGSAGEWREALSFYEQALPLFRVAQDKRGEAVTLNSIGVSYARLGEKGKSRMSYEDALKLFEEAGDCRSVGPAFSNLALESLDTGDRLKALDYLNQALAAQRAAGDREGEATTLNNLGFVYNSAGDQGRALEHFHRALALARETKNRKGEGDTLSNLMFTWAARRRAGLAIFYGKQAVNAYQEVRVAIPPLDRQAQINFIKPRELTYHRLAELLIEQGRLVEAQQVVGLLKEEEYYQFARRGGDGGGAEAKAATLTPAEADAQRRYGEIADGITARGRQRAELLDKASRTAEDNRHLAEIDSELAVAGQAFQSFLDQLSAELGDTKQAARVEQVRESQGLMEDLRELGANSVALYTLVGEEKYRVILITPDAQVAREYPIKASELNKKVAAFREVLQHPSADPRPLAQELYRIVVGPVAKDLEQAHAETLMWSLDGALRYVPVAALHDGTGYMVERYRNVVFTPASTARLKDEPHAEWKAAGFGVSKAYEGFSPLPAVPGELRGIIREEADGASGSGILPGRIALDEAFTADAFRAALRERYPVVHVASHFSFQPGRETDSFLLLGDGDRLPLSQIRSAQNLFGGVDLLTLSACDTATGGAGADGKEVEGFGVLAQRQGAKAVLASLWPVADESTRLLMQNFYRLRNGPPVTLKAEALRQAQLLLLRSGNKAPARSGRGDMQDGVTSSRGLSVQSARVGPKGVSFAHPYFWAPFILIGNWR